MFSLISIIVYGAEYIESKLKRARGHFIPFCVAVCYGTHILNTRTRMSYYLLNLFVLLWLYDVRVRFNDCAKAKNNLLVVCIIVYVYAYVISTYYTLLFLYTYIEETHGNAYDLERTKAKKR